MIPFAEESATEDRAMMGRRRRDQGKLFYEFRLDDRVPQDHLLRRIDVVVTAALADLHQELEPYYNRTPLGRSRAHDPHAHHRLLLRHPR